MKTTRREFGATLLAATAAAGAQTPKGPARRACFLGMHFDLHPRDVDTALGRDITPEMVERFLDRVKPDYVQYDYKGHVGFIGYPSQISAAAPVVKDSLRIWRDITARRGVSLYIHFSGVWDSQAVKEHPEWARVRPDGTPDDRQTSTFGPYVDERMVLQLKEAIRNYDIDGAWVDGECWATNPDYCETAAKAFQAKTGIHPPPAKPEDRGWNEWLEFQREQFRKYLRHYLDEMHLFRPGVEIASNWMYTTYVPEPPELPVDFISGDYLGNACISRARLEARYLSHVGKPWDLMAWGFQSGRSNALGPIHKSSVQLMQEASVVLAQGGGFQIYYQPTRAGYLDDRHVGVMERVANFCREREALCHKSETVPETGVLFSRHSLYHRANKLFGGWSDREDPARGAVDALVDSQQCVDVIPDWKLAELAPAYRLIVVPDWPEIGDEVRDTLLGYARGGGTLLLFGAEVAALFADDLQVSLSGKADSRPAYIPGAEVFADVSGVWQDVEPRGAHVLETRFPTYDATRDGKVAATLALCGDGRIAAFYGPLGTAYAQTHAPETRVVIARIVRKLLEPSVEVTGPPVIEVVRRRKEGREVLHFLNFSGMQVAAEYGAIDYVPPAGPLTVRIRMAHPPVRVTIEPEGSPVKGSWSGGVWTGKLERVDLHTHARLVGAVAVGAPGRLAWLTLRAWR